MDAERENLATDMMNKIAEDIGNAITRNSTLVPPELMLTVAARGVNEAIAWTAMILDGANGVPFEKVPTKESMAFVALYALHTAIRSDDPWNDAVTDVKKYFPDAKIIEVEIVDRRTKKQEAA